MRKMFRRLYILIIVFVRFKGDTEAFFNAAQCKTQFDVRSHRIKTAKRRGQFSRRTLLRQTVMHNSCGVNTQLLRTIENKSACQYNRFKSGDCRNNSKTKTGNHRRRRGLWPVGGKATEESGCADHTSGGQGSPGWPGTHCRYCGEPGLLGRIGALLD